MESSSPVACEKILGATAPTRPLRGGHKRLRMGLLLRSTTAGALLVSRCCLSCRYTCLFCIVGLYMSLVRSGSAVAPVPSAAASIPLTGGLVNPPSTAAREPSAGVVPVDGPFEGSGKAAADAAPSSSAPSMSATPSTQEECIFRRGF